MDQAGTGGTRDQAASARRTASGSRSITFRKARAAPSGRPYMNDVPRLGDWE
jgi:hypothetical protein